MEIELKVPLVEKAYSTVAVILIALRYTLLIGGFLFLFMMQWFPELAILGGAMVIARFPLYIINSLFRNYKLIGEIVFGYHAIRVNGTIYPVKEIEKIFGKFEREAEMRAGRAIAVQGENNLICFYIDGIRHYHQVLLNINDMEALDILIKKWAELYGLKIGRFYKSIL